MSAEAKKFYTLKEYFELELSTSLRYEYWNGEVHLMSGAQPNHNRIVGNINRHLGNQLEKSDCEVFATEQRVKVHAGSPYRYPDVVVACPKPLFERIGGILSLTNPTVIIEVLSPSTAQDDKKLKFTQYQTISTLQEYLLVNSEEISALHYKKQTDESWLPEIIKGADAAVHFAAIDCTLKLADIYAKVDFSLQ
jgi:Uma2 family endonuclease